MTQEKKISDQADDINELYLLFLLKGDTYAVRVGSVKHIIRYGDVSSVPGGLETAIGIAEVRGESILIFDTSRLLGEGHSTYGDDNFIMLCESSEGHSFGLAVDEMKGVIHLTNNQLSFPEGADQAGTYLTGTANTPQGILVIINVDKIGRNNF